jgi:hypothetical protein
MKSKARSCNAFRDISYGLLSVKRCEIAQPPGTPPRSPALSPRRASAVHAYVDEAAQGQIAPAAGQVLEGAGGAGLIDLQPALAHGCHLAEHGIEALLVHPLEQLKSLEAIAHGILPQPLWLIETQIAGGDAAPQALGFVASSTDIWATHWRCGGLIRLLTSAFDGSPKRSMAPPHQTLC